MAETLYADGTVSGTASTPANAHGAQDGSFTTDTGNTNWTHRWSLDNLVGTIDGSASVQIVVRARKESAGGNDPTILNIDLYDGATLLGSDATGWTISSATGQDVTVNITPSPAITNNGASLAVEVNTQGSGGNPSLRRAVQVDSITVTVQNASADRTAQLAWAEFEVPDAPRKAQISWAELEVPTPSLINLVGTPQIGTAADGQDVTLTFDGTPAEGDYVVVFGGVGATSTRSIGPKTAGYTQIVSMDKAASDTAMGGAWYKKMGATPDTTVLCDGGGVGTDGVGYISFVLRGVDPTTFNDATPVEATAVQTSTSTPDPEAITTVTDGAWVFPVIFAGSNFPTLNSAPTGYSNGSYAGQTDTERYSVAVSSKDVATAGAEDPGTYSMSQATDYWTFTIAVRPETVGAPRKARISWAELETPSAPRAAQISWAELELPDGARTAQIAWAELEIPTAPRRAQISWAEMEIGNAPRRAQLSWAELELPEPPKRARISWAELELPDGARAAQVSWAELEIPTAPRRARISWAEFETTDPPRRARVSWTELEFGDAPRTAQLAWAEFEIPTAPRRAQIAWTELEIPTAPRKARLAWAELETPSVTRAARLAWAELETPDAPRRARLAWAEMEIDNAPRKSRLAWAEMELPDGARRGRVAWAEMELPDAPRRAQVAWAEVEVPDAPRKARVSWAEVEVPNQPNRKARIVWAEMQLPDAPGGSPRSGSTRLMLTGVQ